MHQYVVSTSMTIDVDASIPELEIRERSLSTLAINFETLLSLTCGIR